MCGCYPSARENGRVPGELARVGTSAAGFLTVLPIPSESSRKCFVVCSAAPCRPRAPSPKKPVAQERFIFCSGGKSKRLGYTARGAPRRSGIYPLRCQPTLRLNQLRRAEVVLSGVAGVSIFGGAGAGSSASDGSGGWPISSDASLGTPAAESAQSQVAPPPEHVSQVGRRWRCRRLSMGRGPQRRQLIIEAHGWLAVQDRCLSAQ